MAEKPSSSISPTCRSCGRRIRISLWLIFSLLLPAYVRLFITSDDVLYLKLSNLLMGITPLEDDGFAPSFIMVQLGTTAQNLYKYPKWLRRVDKEDAGYSMVAKKNDILKRTNGRLVRRKAGTLMCHLEEK